MHLSSSSRRVALGAILAAFSVVLLAVANLVTTLDLTLAALAALAVLLAQIEGGFSLSLPVFFVTGLLSVLLFPVKTAPMFYLCFFGWYPIFRQLVQKLAPVLAWTLKILLAAVGLALAYLAARFVFFLPELTSEFTLPVLALGMAGFVVYEIGLNRLLFLYLSRFRHRLMRK